MDTNVSRERRSEGRLRYQWPVWISDDPGNDRIIQGQMVDINSQAVAFTFRTNDGQPWVNQHLTTRFGVPKYDQEGAFDVVDFIREGHVHRVERLNPSIWRVVMQFHESLPFHPAQEATDQVESDPELVPAFA
jgi:hypothetical protein